MNYFIRVILLVLTFSVFDKVSAQANNYLFTWGSNKYDQLGSGSTSNSASPKVISNSIKWRKVETNAYHSFGLKHDGTLWTWGYNRDGQLGKGNRTNYNTPTQVGTDTNWLDISTGDNHTLALRTDGSLWAWGNNANGRLGLGNQTIGIYTTPQRIGSDTDWVIICVGWYHSMAIKSDGTLWAWGRNAEGQCGYNSRIQSTSPKRVGSDTNWSKLAAGTIHSLGLKDDGTLWAWGDNQDGQLGVNSKTQSFNPTQVGSDSNWVSISAGGTNSLAIKSNGTLWTWGDNEYGQLGNGQVGKNLDVLVPKKIGTDTNWFKISGGRFFNLALKRDNSLWFWGAKTNNELGVGWNFSFQTYDSIPINIGRSFSWSDISAGAAHAVALGSDITSCDNYSVKFDGSNDKITTTNPLSNHDSLTVGIWVKLESNTGHRVIMSDWPSGGANFSINQNYSGGKDHIRVQFRNGSTGPLDLSTQINSDYYDKWTLINVVVNPDSVKVFLDGKWVKSAKNSFGQIVKRSNTLTIGDEENKTSPFKGSISEVYFVNRNYSNNEISALTNRRLSINTSNLLALYRLNEGTGNSSDVLTGNVSTLQNGASWILDSPFKSSSSNSVISYAESTSDTLVICSSDSVTLQVPSWVKNIRWFDSSTNTQILVNNEGQFWVQYDDSLGCSQSDTVRLIESNYKPVLKDTTICSGDTINLQSNLKNCESPSGSLANGLIGWYTFCGDASDYSDLGNDGTVTGATLTTDRFGNSKSAYYFNGTSNYIKCDSLPLDKKATISIWALNERKSTDGEWKGLITTQDNNKRGFLIQDNQGMKYWGTVSNGSGYYNLTSTTQINNSKWVHLVLTIDNGKMALFVNGKQEATTTLSSYVLKSGAKLNIGSRYSNEFFKGKLDDVGIWNRILTNSEITALYSSSSNSPVINWSTGDTTESIKYTTTGTNKVWVSVTDEYGTCTDTATVSISNPIVKIGTSDTITVCGSDTINLSATSGFTSYLWSNSDTLGQSKYTGSGIASLIATDSLGCSATDSAMYSALNPVIQPRDTTICSGDTLELSIDPFAKQISNKPQYKLIEQFKMTFGSKYDYTTKSLDSTKKYLLEVTGRYGVADGKAYQDAAFNYAWNNTNQKVFCNGGTITPFNQYDWQWNNTKSFAMPTNNTNNLCCFCSGTDKIYYWEINNTSGKQKFSFFDNAYGDNSGSLTFKLYEDTSSNILWSTGGTTETIKYTTTGKNKVWVSVSDEYGTCSDTATITISNPVVKIGTSDTITVCGSDTLNLSATSGFTSYLWSNSDTLGQSKYTGSGIASVIATDSLGCTATDSAWYSALNPIIQPRDTTICSGDTLDLSVSIDSTLIGNSSQSSGTIPMDSLIAWYPFDGNLQDTSGNQLALSSGSGSTTYQSDRNSNVNSSLYFDGSNYYSMGNNSTLQPSKFTISCWVKFSSSNLNNVETIVGYSPSNWNKGAAWKLMKHPADLNYKKGIRFRMWTSSTGNQDVVIENISIDTSQWYNFIMSFDGKKQILYMDGGNMGDRNSVLSYSGLDQIYVGAGRESSSGTFTDFFKGLIDDVIIWNRALTNSEIGSLYKGNYTLPSITWSTGDTTESISYTDLGRKDIWVELSDDYNSCTDTISVSISDPKFSFSSDTLLFTDCSRDSLKISAPGQWSKYNWNNGANDSFIYAKDSGLVQVTLEDSLGCKVSDSLYFVNPGKVESTITQIDSVNCYLGSSGSALTQTQGGFSPYTYLWNDASAQTTANASNLKKGVYKLIAKDIYGCSDSVTATVHEPTKVSITGSTIDSVNCYLGSDGSVVTTTGGGSGGYTYQWDDASSQTTATASNLKKGTYKLIVKDIYGCSDSASYAVQEPTKVSLSVTATDSVNCYLGADGSINTSISGGSNGYTYLWNDASAQTTANASNLKKGVYKLIAKDIYGCSDSVTATVHEPTKVSITGSTIDSVNCYLGSDGSVVTTTGGGSGGYTYQWDDASSQTTATASNLKKGTYKLIVKDIYGCSDSASYAVQEPTKVSLSVTATDSVNCYLGADGSINTSISGGSNGYTYLWNDASAQTTANASNLKKGVYKLIAKDIYGCSDSVTATVHEPMKVSITGSTIDSVNCYLGSDGSVVTTTGGGSGGYTYQWDDASSQTTATASNLKKGTYKLIVKDIYGCSDSASYAVQEPTKVSLSVTATDSVNCYLGADGSINTSISGGSNGYTYLWNDASAQTTANASNLKKGVYKLIAKDIYGCSDSVTATVHEPTKVSITGSTIDSVNCYLGSDGSVVTTTGGGSGGYTYQWDDASSQTTATASNLKKGTYKLIVKDIYGCSDSASYAVQEPTKVSLSVTATDSVNCYLGADGSINTSISGGSNGYTYLWNDASAQTTANASNLKKGVYKLIAKDIYGCSDSVTATVHEPTKVSITGSTIDSVNCYLGSDGSVVTTTGGGSGGYTYQWDDASSQTTATASNLKKGTYKLIVKDIYGCSDSASYAVQEPTKVSIVEAKIKDAICYGYSNGEVRTSTQGGTPPYTHLWNSNPPQYSFNATDLLAGDYKYIVRDVYGCSDSVEVTINEPEEVIPKIIEPLLTMKGMNVKLNVDVDPLGPDYYYQWEPLDVFKDFATNPNPVITLNETTDIKVTVSNQAGCFGQDSINMQVIQPLSKILPNAITPNGDGLNDVFKANDYFELLDLKIYNRWGQMVYKSLGSQKGWDGTFAGEKVPAGVYVYVIQVKLKYTNQTISHTGNITIIQ